MTDRFIANNPKDAGALANRAMFYAKLGNIPQALLDVAAGRAADTKDVSVMR
jgi:regulator of sirC expression with transglutaminase-like and TPR domain